VCGVGWRRRSCVVGRGGALTTPSPPLLHSPLRVQHGRTALHLAATAGKLEATRVLLAHGAPTEARDSDGYTPLILAGRYGRGDVVRALLAAGADVRAEDGAGHKASDAARHGGHAALADLLIEAELG
jgi:ankyrin repeat protein